MKTRKRSIPRNIEIALASLGLVLVAPLMIAAAALIKLSSRGPVLFRQDRVGLNGKKFTMFKLRTMTVSDGGAKITAADDLRVTRVGKILRRTKVDELPELWNVLRGDMSFVGPRPEVPDYVDLADPQWLEILDHRPGITDPVTLRLRNEEALLASVTDRERYYQEVIQPYKVRGYLRFVRNKSWKTDIRIVARTIWVVAFPAAAKTPTKEELKWSFAE
ncbi:MAG: sugar transferase [Aridibacter famidurans]|nr:sugar transferase [Aridibacter famidurans]